jgi:hypothetical protein
MTASPKKFPEISSMARLTRQRYLPGDYSIVVFKGCTSSGEIAEIEVAGV